MSSAESEPPLIVVTARMASSRLPGKAIALLHGRPLISHLLERMASIWGAARVVLATSAASENEVLIELAGKLGVAGFVGDEEDVLGRHIAVSRMFGAQHLVRVTGDNPLTDRGLIRQLSRRHMEAGADYTYVPGEALLMGILPEVVSMRALEQSHRDGEDRHRSELVTLYIKENPTLFSICREALPDALNRPQYRLTVDEPEDLKLMEAVFDRLHEPGKILDTAQALRLLDAEPSLRAVNESLRHKAANLRSVALDATPGGTP